MAIRMLYPFGPIVLDAPREESNVTMIMSDGSPHPAPEDYMEAKRWTGKDGKPASLIDILGSLGVTDKSRAN